MTEPEQQASMAAVLRANRRFALAFLVLLALHVALISSARLLPFIDLPYHLASATIMRFVGDPSNHLRTYYAVDTFLEPNTFHAFFCSLKIFPSVEFANRVFFIIYAILLPVAALLVVTKLGASPWFSLLSFLLLYNCSASWGFVGFAFAIPLVLLFSRAFILEAAALESLRGASLAAAFVALLYFVHVLAALFCVLLLVMNLAFRGTRSPRLLVGSAIALAPLIIILEIWSRHEERFSGGARTLAHLASYYRYDFGESFAQRKELFVFDNFRLFAGGWGYAAALLFCAVIVLPAALFLVKRAARGGSAAQEAAPAGASVAERSPARGGAPLFLVASFLCCIALPNEIPGVSIIYPRFSVFLLLAIIFCGAELAPRKIPRALPPLFAAVAACHLALWSQYFVGFNRENAGFDKSFLEPSASGTKLAGLIYDYKYRGAPMYIHFPNYYIVWEKSPATSKIIDYRYGPIRRTVGGAEFPSYLEWVGAHRDYDGRYRMMDYILVRGRVAEGADTSSSTQPVVPLEDLKGFRPKRVCGKWTLYETIAPPQPAAERAEND